MTTPVSGQVRDWKPTGQAGPREGPPDVASNNGDVNGEGNGSDDSGGGKQPNTEYGLFQTRQLSRALHESSYLNLSTILWARWPFFLQFKNVAWTIKKIPLGQVVVRR